MAYVIAACEICGRILKYIPVDKDEETCTPENSGYMNCSKCGQQTTWRIINIKNEGKKTK